MFDRPLVRVAAVCAGFAVVCVAGTWPPVPAHGMLAGSAKQAVACRDGSDVASADDAGPGVSADMARKAPSGGEGQSPKPVSDRDAGTRRRDETASDGAVVPKASSAGASAEVSAGVSAPEAAPDPVVDLGGSIEAYGSYDAHDGGALVYWEPGYYIAHSWSEAGQKISSLEVGDRFRVDGAEYEVTGMSDFAEGFPYEDVRNAVGWDALCLQTCIEGTGRFVVVYSSGAGYFPGVYGDVEQYSYEVEEPIEEPDEGVSSVSGEIHGHASMDSAIRESVESVSSEVPSVPESSGGDASSVDSCVSAPSASASVSIEGMASKP